MKRSYIARQFIAIILLLFSFTTKLLSRQELTVPTPPKSIEERVKRVREKLYTNNPEISASNKQGEHPVQPIQWGNYWNNWNNWQNWGNWGNWGNWYNW